MSQTMTYLARLTEPPSAEDLRAQHTALIDARARMQEIGTTVDDAVSEDIPGFDPDLKRDAVALLERTARSVDAAFARTLDFAARILQDTPIMFDETGTITPELINAFAIAMESVNSCLGEIAPSEIGRHTLH